MINCIMTGPYFDYIYYIISSYFSNLYRYGRAGGVWRHVRSCVANTGNQIAFIDGRLYSYISFVVLISQVNNI